MADQLDSLDDLEAPAKPAPTKPKAAVAQAKPKPAQAPAKDNKPKTPLSERIPMPLVVSSNAVAVGMSALGVTLFLFAMLQLNLISMKTFFYIAFTYGGIIQTLAGLKEMMTGGNRFYSAVFTAYGALFLALPSFMMFGKPDNLDLGIIYGIYAVYTCILFLANFKTTIYQSVMFGLLDIAFILLTTASLTNTNMIIVIVAVLFLVVILNLYYTYTVLRKSITAS